MYICFSHQNLGYSMAYREYPVTYTAPCDNWQLIVDNTVLQDILVRTLHTDTGRYPVAVIRLVALPAGSMLEWKVLRSMWLHRSSMLIGRWTSSSTNSGGRQSARMHHHPPPHQDTPGLVVSVTASHPPRCLQVHVLTQNYEDVLNTQ